MNHQNDLKLKVAEHAFAYLKPHLTQDMILGIGTGSTVNFLIEVLAEYKELFKGAVASSVASQKLLQERGIEVFNLDEAPQLEFYLDGADEADSNLNLIKGGGAALTREKVIASFAQTFICIADSSKKVSQLGKFALPVEVIPMAQSLVKRKIIELGGKPELRENCITDNGNLILDVQNLDFSNPSALEMQLNNIAGVVCAGIFALRGADILFLADAKNVQEIYKNS